MVHLDGSARPRIIRRDANSLYHDILAAFEERSGIPALINTSFNVHEEADRQLSGRVRAGLDRRIDFVVTENGLYTMRS